MDTTAVIFCCGSDTRRLLGLVFIIGPLGCIVNKFLVTVHQHFNLALFGADRHALVANATDHVKRIPRLTAQGQLQGVFLNTLFQEKGQGKKGQARYVRMQVLRF